ncbi:MAG TPA: winged helix DNA-binding domain-containing protein, partial [Candidatus Limnocylindria bacterium]|nr:winged helix DNA-binding domain-containing protein [Candidatus Limnocylindria bacterium]
GLWCRLDGFQTDDLASLLVNRRVARVMGLLRGTIHLVTARDALSIRAMSAPVMQRIWRSTSFAKALEGLETDAVVAHGRHLLAERPQTAAELGRRLQERWPDRDAQSLAYAVTFHVPLVQPPPRGLWGRSGRAMPTLLEDWLGAGPDPQPSVDELVIRYLRALGPAAPQDAATWSRFTALREVFDRLRPRLRTFRDENGRVLFDVPDGPLPNPDTPAPVRFLPEYDNVVLSHHDRSRIIDRRWPQATWMRGTILVDGFVRGTWRLDREREVAVLSVAILDEIRPEQRDEVEHEADALLAFAASDAKEHRVREVGAGTTP